MHQPNSRFILLVLSVCLLAACQETTPEKSADPDMMVDPGDPNPDSDRREDPPVVEPIECAEFDGPLDFVVDKVFVSGAVTVNGGSGQSFIEWDTSAQIEFVDVETGWSHRDTLEGGPGSAFEVGLPTGVYDVRIALQRDGSFARQWIDLEAGLVVDSSARMDFDVATNTLTARVLADGASLPEGVEALGGRGSLVFTDTGTGQVWDVLLPIDGESEVTRVFPAGRAYSVVWKRLGRLEGIRQTDEVPYGEKMIATWTSDAPTSLDWDLGAVVDLEGEITVQNLLEDPTPLPNDTRIDGDPRAEIRFLTNGDRWDSIQVPLGETGPGTFRVKILAGGYQVEFTALDYTAGGTLAPYESVDLCENTRCGCIFSPGQRLDVGLREQTRFSVGGHFSIGGEAWLSQELVPDTRGGLNFRRLGDNKSIYAEIWRTGGFQTELPNGTYAVTYSGSTPGLSGTVTLAEDLRVTGPITDLAFEVEPVRVRGEVLVNGQTMPDNGVMGSDRADIQFWGEDGLAFRQMALGETGPATFDVFLYPGHYEVHLNTKGNGGHGLLVPYAQDVLPLGRKKLDRLVVDAQTEPLDYNLDAAVVGVEGVIEQPEEGDYAVNLIRLMDLESAVERGLWPNRTWVRVAPEDGAFEALVYEGSYGVVGGRGDIDFLTGYSAIVGLGEVCVGER